MNILSFLLSKSGLYIAVFLVSILISAYIYYLNIRVSTLSTQRDNAVLGLEQATKSYEKNLEISIATTKAKTVSQTNYKSVINQNTQLKKTLKERGDLTDEYINDDFISFSF